MLGTQESPALFPAAAKNDGLSSISNPLSVLAFRLRCDPEHKRLCLIRVWR
jgi:hypothetical protein